jgi:cobalt/nickel transport system permease protein
MHMIDALVSPTVALTMYGCSSLVTMHSVKRLHQRSDQVVPVMGVVGAFVFAVQMVNFAIPGTGSSGHLIGGVLLTALLGPSAAFISMVSVLVIQSLLFADGGILALGCNIWNMAFYSCILSYYLIWKPLTRQPSKQRIFLASVISGIVVLQLGAASIGLQVYLSQVTTLTLTTILITMQPIHLVIGLIEGLVTGAILWYIFQIRPELLFQPNIQPVKQSKFILTTVLLLSFCIAGLSFVISSSLPDGLEWSIEQLSMMVPLRFLSSYWHQYLGIIQRELAIFSYEPSNGQGLLVAGSIMVSCLLCGSLYRKMKQKNGQT